MKCVTNPVLALLVSLAASAGLAAGATERPTIAVTQWTDAMELFMEYPAPVSNESTSFIVHLTIREGFQPVREGVLTLQFHGPDGFSQQVLVDELLREGIFKPTVTLAQAGAYELELTYAGPGATSSFSIDGFAVAATEADIPADAGHGATGEITFLKEQQWKIPFATTTATTRELRRGTWAIGEVLPAPSAFVEIVAPVDGVVQVTEAGQLALPGAYVARGQVVARLVPPLQGPNWAETQLAFAQARRNYDRAQSLWDQDAIAERDLEAARNEFLTLQAAHRHLAGSGSDGTLALTAPLAGQVIDWQVRPGQRLKAGDRLMAIADPTVVWLKVNVYENEFRRLGTPVGAYVHNGGSGGGWSIPASDLKVIAAGGALNPVTRTIPVLLEVDNADLRLTINESTPVELYGGDGSMATAVPRSAVFEDEGLDVVYVQISGESFAKRQVELGPRDGDWVSILSGVADGEWIVTRGGYHVKLASTSAEIGHGHAH